jgi:cell wall-associated NlpC family hydrolase
VRLRGISAFATTIVLFGAFAASAEARHKHRNPKQSGGAVAPVQGTGGTAIGSTSVTGATGTTGSTGATTPLLTANLAPIVLAKGQKPTEVYNGPVFQETAGGLIPYATADATTPTTPTTTSSIAGGTTATTSSDMPTPTPTQATTTLPELLVPGNTAEEVKVDGLGLAAAPENAPVAVQEVIWRANQIIGRPYVYGGGHKSFNTPGYDCSGTVSYALHGANLLKSPLDSSQFESWGASGQGQWMTILTNAGHAYMDVAGLRLDTSPENDPSNLEGPRWRPLRPGNPGFMVRHPIGF